MNSQTQKDSTMNNPMTYKLNRNILLC